MNIKIIKFFSYQNIILLIIFFLSIILRLYYSQFHDGVIGDAETYLNASKGIFNPEVPYSYHPTWPDEKCIAQPLYSILNFMGIDGKLNNKSRIIQKKPNGLHDPEYLRFKDLTFSPIKSIFTNPLSCEKLQKFSLI